jgi:hypothetical protein
VSTYGVEGADHLDEFCDVLVGLAEAFSLDALRLLVVFFGCILVPLAIPALIDLHKIFLQFYLHLTPTVGVLGPI